MKTKLIRALVIAAVATSATLPVRAATDRIWTGGQTGVDNTEASPYDIWNTSNWDGSGSVGSGNALNFSVSGKTYIKSTKSDQVADDFIVKSGDFVFIGPLYFRCYKGIEANASSSVLKKGDWKIKDYGLRFGGGAGTKVAFTNESGDVTLENYNNSIIDLANGEGAEVEVVNISGDWTTYKNIYIAKGVNSTASFILKGGKFTTSNYLVVGQGSGAVGNLIVEGGEVKQTKNDIPIGDGDSSTGIVTVKTNGKITSSSAYSGFGIRVGCAGTGTLNVESGEVELTGGAIGLCTTSDKIVSGTVNITGGTVTTSQIKYGSGSGAGTLTIDGGTVRAYANNVDFIPAHNNLDVYVGANGATIDANGNAITIGSVLANKSGEAGKVTFKGGGLVTLSGTPSYTGGTTIEAGTTLSLTAAAMEAVFAHDVSVEMPSTGAADGTSVFQITDGGTFTQAEVDAIALVGNDGSRYALALEDSGTKVVIVDTQAAEYMWNGGSSGVNWTDESKWLCDGAAATWAEGNIAVFANEGDEATVDSDVTAASVAFRADATVAAGEGTLTASSVAVSNGVEAVINVATAGTLEKTGEGTLTLGASRTGQTTLIEGTLVMSGSGTTLDWTKLTFGTDARKPVTLQFTDGATLAGLPQAIRFPTTADRSATIVKDSCDWNVGNNNFTLCNAAGTTAGFIQNGGTLTCGNYFVIGDDSSATSASMTINGGTVNCTKNADDYIAIGSHCAGSLTVKGANSAFNATANSLSVGRNAVGTLTVEDGGTVSVATDICLSRNSGGAGSSVTLKSGGTVVAERVRGNYDGTIVFDGGILKARTTGKTLIDGSNNLAVSVASNGGTVDTDGKTVTIDAAISGEGGMTFKGGGSVSLAAGNTYTGTTTVEIGTTVHIPSASALAGKVVFSIPATLPEEGVYSSIVIDGEGTFPSAILDNVEKPTGVTALRLSGDGKSVLCIYGNPANTWTGGASGSLGDWANWSLGYVPYRDSCVIGYATAATLTNPAGSWFEPSSITFPADSAAVTIVGEGAISDINEIKNLSPSVNHVFNVAVSGPENAAVVMNTQTYCVFSGGMTAYDVDFSESPETDNARTFAGQWTLTKTADWTPPKNATVADGASLTVKNYSNNASDTLLIKAGGVVTAEVAKVTGSYAASVTHYLTRGIYGTMVVTDECKMDSGSVNAFVRDEASTGTIIAKKFSSTSTSIKYLLKNDNGFRYVVGAGGITGTGWKGYANWNSVIACTNDFEITGTIDGYTSGTKNTYTLDTTGGYRVSLAPSGKLTGARMALNVIGDGTLALVGGTADFQKGLTVNDGATVAVNAGCTPGNGEVMVKEGATFEVSGGGSVPLGGNLKLMDGATLRFNFKSRKNPPVMKMNGNPVWFGSTTNVTVTF